MIITRKKLQKLNYKNILQGKKKIFLTNCFKYETIGSSKYGKENIND